MRVNATHFHKVVTLVCFLLQVFEFEIHQGGKRGDFLPVEGKRTKWVSFLSLLWKNSRIQNNNNNNNLFSLSCTSFLLLCSLPHVG